MRKCKVTAGVAILKLKLSCYRNSEEALGERDGNGVYNARRNNKPVREGENPLSCLFLPSPAFQFILCIMRFLTFFRVTVLSQTLIFSTWFNMSVYLQPRMQSRTMKNRTARGLKGKLFNFQNVYKIYSGVSQMSKINSNFWENSKLDMKNNLSACSKERGNDNK